MSEAGVRNFFFSLLPLLPPFRRVRKRKYRFPFVRVRDVVSLDVIIGEIIGEAAMNKIGTKEERNISSPFPSARVSSRNNWRGKYLASRSTTDWHFNPVARVDKHVIPSTIFAGCSTSPPSPGQPLFLYFSELFGCLKSALMLLKFLAKQWLNDEPLPARGKRAEGTILTEIRRAPHLFLPLCDAPRILRAPYCETRIIDICYTSVSFSNGIDQTWRQWGEKFFTVYHEK